jgi:hypothetical protein
MGNSDFDKTVGYFHNSPFLTYDVVPGPNPKKRTVARGINLNRIVVGAYVDNGRRHAFRWNPATGAVDTWDVPELVANNGPVSSTNAAGINNDGYIVGDFETDTGDYGYRLSPFVAEGVYDATSNDPNKRPDAASFLLIDLKKADDDLVKVRKIDPLSIGTHATCINHRNDIGGRIFFPRPFVQGTTKEVYGFLMDQRGYHRIEAGPIPDDEVSEHDWSPVRHEGESLLSLGHQPSR